MVGCGFQHQIPKQRVYFSLYTAKICLS
uniref:Uncharacterized protein n=1 Tax=Anguilla anguilla TaxID=7936 RepID=A0A0E9W127_ANGAN